jgi:hypothetical protein
MHQTRLKARKYAMQQTTKTTKRQKYAQVLKARSSIAYMLAAYFFLACLARLPSSKILTFKSLLSGFLLPTLVYSLLQFIHSLSLLISTLALLYIWA